MLPALPPPVSAPSGGTEAPADLDAVAGALSGASSTLQGDAVRHLGRRPGDTFALEAVQPVDQVEPVRPSNHPRPSPNRLQGCRSGL